MATIARVAGKALSAVYGGGVATCTIGLPVYALATQDPRHPLFNRHDGFIDCLTFTASMAMMGFIGGVIWPVLAYDGLSKRN